MTLNLNQYLEDHEDDVCVTPALEDEMTTQMSKALQTAMQMEQMKAAIKAHDQLGLSAAQAGTAMHSLAEAATNSIDPKPKPKLYGGTLAENLTQSAAYEMGIGAMPMGDGALSDSYLIDDTMPNAIHDAAGPVWAKNASTMAYTGSPAFSGSMVTNAGQSPAFPVQEAPTPALSAKRRSGRTTRMLEAALEHWVKVVTNAAGIRGGIVVVGADGPQRNDLRHAFRQLVAERRPDLLRHLDTTAAYTVATSDLNRFDILRPLTPLDSKPYHRVFVDHHVFERHITLALAAWSQYDDPASSTPIPAAPEPKHFGHSKLSIRLGRQNTNDSP